MTEDEADAIIVALHGLKQYIDMVVLSTGADGNEAGGLVSDASIEANYAITDMAQRLAVRA